MTEETRTARGLDVKEQIRESIRMLADLDQSTPGVLAKGIRELKPADVATVLQDFSEEDARGIIAAQPPVDAGETLIRTDPITRQTLLARIEDSRMAEILKALPPDEAADILKLLGSREREEVLTRIGGEQAGTLRQLEVYDSHSAGGMMTTRFLSVGEEASVEDALAAARSRPEVESFHCVYVVDDKGRPKGVVSARRLISASPDTPVGSIMKVEVATVRFDEDREAVAAAVRKHRIEAVPVVDRDGRLLGVVTFDDVIGIIDDEANEEALRISGTAAMHPTRAPILRRVVLRLPWLVVTLAGEIVVSMVIRQYQVSLESLLAIVLFIPAVTAMGGGVAVQSAVIAVRGLAAGEVDYSRLLRVLLGEMRVGALLGLALGAITAAFVHFYLSGETYASTLGIAVGTAIFAGMLASAVVGTLVPFVCWRFGIDPAITAGPFVGVLSDILCTAIYFAVSTAVLIGSIS